MNGRVALEEVYRTLAQAATALGSSSSSWKTCPWAEKEKEKARPHAAGSATLLSFDIDVSR